MAAKGLIQPNPTRAQAPGSNVYKTAEGYTGGNPFAQASSGYQGHGAGAPGGQTVIRSGDTSGSAFRGNLQTNFQGRWDDPNAQYRDYGNDSDADVREAQRITNERSAANAGLDPGFNSAENNANLTAVMARIGLKNSLGQAIGGNAELEGRAEDSIKGTANQAMHEGLHKTRENFNNRGLLYSGMREGGEGQVKANVAGEMAGDLSSNKREFSNLQDQQKAAYASIGLAQQKEKVDLANQTFDTVSRNNVAKLQAYQELAGGVGKAAGMYAYGKFHGDKPTLPPNTTEP